MSNRKLYKNVGLLENKVNLFSRGQETSRWRCRTSLQKDFNTGNSEKENYAKENTPQLPNTVLKIILA